MKFARLLPAFSLIFFCSSVYNILAQAPQTPKIVFSLIDNKQNSEIYLMNPDGFVRLCTFSILTACL